MANNRNSHQNTSKQNTNKKGYQSQQRKDEELEKLRKRIFQLEQNQTINKENIKEKTNNEEIKTNNQIKSRKERLNSLKNGKNESKVWNISKNVVMIAGAMVVVELFVILKYKIMFWMFF